MRRLLVPSLLRAVRRNRSVGRAGRRALRDRAPRTTRPAAGPTEALADEPWTSALVLAGRLGGSSWTGAGREADFFTAKGVLETALRPPRRAVRLEPLQQPYLHPGRAARVLVGADAVRAGEIGELHPSTAARFDLEGRVAVLELDLDLPRRGGAGRVCYAPVPDQPPVLQDIAVVVDDGVAGRAARSPPPARPARRC